MKPIIPVDFKKSIQAENDVYIPVNCNKSIDIFLEVGGKYDILNLGDEMKKTKIYLDTSVISFYFAEDSPEKMAITRKFFDRELAGRDYEICLSETTVSELSDCTDLELQKKLLKFVKALPAKVYPLTEEVNQIAKEFVDEGYIPAKYQEDAIHLAFAIILNVDYIVSWNFKHIVRPQTRKAVKIIALKEGFKEIEIITPEEVATDENE
jgi:predicted nucleic acid-binding protein